jgi:hypothetical protein
MPVIGKNMISWFYAYVEHIEIKTKTVNIIHFPYLDLSQNVKIRDVKNMRTSMNFSDRFQVQLSIVFLFTNMKTRRPLHSTTAHE